MNPVRAARLDVGLEIEPLELLADQASDADREREAAVGRVEVEEHEVRAMRLSTREYHAFMSMQFICTIQSTASGELTSGKSTSRDPPPRG